MRRPFGGSSGMGGGSGGGGRGMLRTVHRAVRAGVGGATPEPFSQASATATTNTSTTRPTYKRNSFNIPSLSSSTTSSPFSSFNLPISATSTVPTWPPCSSPAGSDDSEWEYIDGSEDDRANGFYDDFVFGSVPSRDEVQQAVTALQLVLDPASFPQFIKGRLAYNSGKDVEDQITSPTGFVHRASSVGSELDWIEPSMQLCNSTMSQPHGSDRVYDAFHLLQTEPSVKRMVVSLASDKAVWDAVLNNEVVRELRESLNEADNSAPGSSDEGSDGSNAATDILSWIFVNAKKIVMEVIEKIMKLMNKLFQPLDSKKKTGGATDPFEEKLRTSFLLSILVLLVVVVSRAHRA